MNATEQYFPVVLFIMLYKVVLTFETMDEILKCDHSNESYGTVLSSDAVYYAVQGGSIFSVCVWNSKVWPFKWKLLSSSFQWCCLVCCTRWFNLWVCGWYPEAGLLIRKLLFVMPYKVPLSFGTVEETLLELFKSKLIRNTFFWCRLILYLRWF